MGSEGGSISSVGLTSTEVSSIWGDYLKNSMELRFFQHFKATTEDNEIRKIVEKQLNQSQKNINAIKDIFMKENLAVPLAFSDEDVKVITPKVFSDIFILYFCNDFTLLSMSIYPSTLSDCARKDVRNHFKVCIDFNTSIQNEIVEIMLSKGVYLKAPQVALDNKVDFAKDKKYLSGILGEKRTVNVAEIANLSRIIHRAQFSKMVFAAFSKLASSKEVKLHFSKGRDELQQVLDSLQEVLDKESIPISASSDYKLFEVEENPFSDKLLLYFVNSCLGMYCFHMLSQAATSCLRSDIVLKVERIMKDMQHYYDSGLKLMINEGWLEEPPQSIDIRS